MKEEPPIQMHANSVSLYSVNILAPFEHSKTLFSIQAKVPDLISSQMYMRISSLHFIHILLGIFEGGLNDDHRPHLFKEENCTLSFL